MKTALKTSAALALIAAYTPAYSQEVFDLGEITLFSSSVPTELNKTGTTTEVITAEEVQAGGTQQLVTVLGALPGLSYAGNGPVGAVQTVSVRGLPARYVPVYFDGIDMTDTTSPQNLFNWGGIMNSGVGRVELLKGSQSALYGSEAIGGVINLSSARLEQEGQRYSFGAEYGAFNTASASLGYQQKTDRADISLSLSRVKSDGFSSADENEGNAEADGYEGTTVVLSTDFAATDRLTLGGTLLYKTSESNIDGFGGAGGDADRPFSNTRRAARLYALYQGARINHSLAISRSANHSLDPLGWTTEFDGSRTEFDYAGDATVAGGTLSFGLAQSREEAVFSGSKAAYDSTAAFGEYAWALSDTVDFSLAARYENSSDFGDAVTGRAAAAWRLSEGTVVRASLGNGFRAPSLYELFGPYGSTSLTEERSISFDLGVEHRYAAGSKVKAALFYNEIDNLIGFSGGSYSQVAGKSVMKGLELSAVKALSESLDLTGAYTYTDSADASGNQLVRVPKHALAIGVQATLRPAVRLEVNLTHVAGRADDGFPARAMDDYTVAHATLSRAVSETTELYLRVENLFDKEYQTSAGYGTSDRALYFGVRASF
ncbi:TonB-dependent siderophore receptor [uncultured Lentibacter sp.]|uniref:TonB-dependent receptor plug domain-containing protein n=1 Tax=uncultured Lentibacter sp. TaxID=1659309 RepID=UPI0026189743|nr:TonB-dependent receptor [uncultured Lentibacter sp.]